MTSITTDTTSTRSSQRSFRQAVVGFLAGALLAGSVAVGIDVTRSDSSTAAPVAHSTSVPSAPACGGRLVHGAC